MNVGEAMSWAEPCKAFFVASAYSSGIMVASVAEQKTVRTYADTSVCEVTGKFRFFSPLEVIECDANALDKE